MDYIIQKKLNEVLEKLLSRVNEGNLNQNLKEEAIKIITKIRLEYKDDIEEYLNKRQFIQKGKVNLGFEYMFDHSFMIEFVSQKNSIDDLSLELEFLYKWLITDENIITWQHHYFQLVEVFFNRIDNTLSKVEFLGRLRGSYKNETYDINTNYILKENAFYAFIKEQIIKEPIIISQILTNDLIPEFDDVTKIKIKNPFLLELTITKFEILKYIPDRFKDDFLINLLSINESIKTREYLHPTYKNNYSFCQLFEL